MPTQSAVALRFLGPLEVIVDGEAVHPGGPKQRALLCYLVLHAGEPVGISSLVEAVWEDDAPGGAIRSLRTYVSNIRRLLGPAVDLRGEQRTYRLDPISMETDIDGFRTAVGEAASLQDPRDRSRMLAAALEMWRGPFLADVDRPWAQEQSVALEAERRRATAAWAEATIAAGRPADVIPVIEHAVADAPLDEQLCSLLMRSLYATGRQADALAVYRRVRNSLAQELGVEPGPELRTLEEQILLHEASRAGPEPEWLLPSPVTDLVGRNAEIEDLLARIEEVRLVTLTGPGGVGKTRLAIEVGRRVMERGDRPVFFADLSTVFDEAAVDAVLASSARVQPHPDSGPLAGLIEYLRPREALLIVDNCEHLAATVARSLAALVRSCSQLTLVATSRAPLHIDGELEWRTPFLELPDRADMPVGELRRWPAVELLLRRAPNSFRMTESNRADVVQLCRDLDGLPLALELAASRLGTMTPAEIVTTLASRVQMSGGGSAEDARHATLAATVDWSYGLLAEQPRRLLDRLGVMSGRFLFEDVLAVCAPDPESNEDVREWLPILVEQSLVMAETSGARTRYRILETIRTFALDRLGDDGPEVRMRHAQHFAELAEFEAARLLTRDEGEAVVELSAAHDNLRSAIGWAMETGDIEPASRIVASIPDWAYWRSHNELTRWAEWVWKMTTPGRSRWRATCGCAARGAWVGDRLDDALRYAGAAEGVVGTVISRSGHPEDVVADVALYRGDAKEALTHYSRVAAEAADRGDITREVWATFYVSVVNAVLGRRSEAAAAATRALALAQQTGNPTTLAFSFYANGLAAKHWAPTEAMTMFEEAVLMADSVGNDWFGGIARMELASTRVAHGDPGAGFAGLAEVIERWHRAGDDTQLRLAWRYLVAALVEAGLTEEAAILIGPLLEDPGSVLTHPRPDVLDELKQLLGDADYTRLTVRGSVMSTSELVAVSLDAIDRVPT